MKLSNFVLIEKISRDHSSGNVFLGSLIFRAAVDVTTGALWWKKTVRREIVRVTHLPIARGSWYFSDTGEFVPEDEIESLARAWTARTGEYC